MQQQDVWSWHGNMLVFGLMQQKVILIEVEFKTTSNSNSKIIIKFVLIMFHPKQWG